NDGFLIAEKDLQMRGPGEFLGERQHGLTGFEAARFAADMQVLNEAREAAGFILNNRALRVACEPLVNLAKDRLEHKAKTIAPN
ncbi:MAG TPA: DNA helicase RecG, partial [Clostridia bacterium]|nr:DNA helicase RecG [Clostridia bacterium]